ncbi:MAG: DUF1804 family protein [Helicobacteraceae bacterium]|nr:DUF1804 family protein [Helicobacteraceae bacterium]
MTNAEKNRLLARTLFVDSKKNDAEIADILDKSERTIANYRSSDKELGVDWYELRATTYIEHSGDDKERLYSDFIGYMYDSVKEVREDEKMSAPQKASAIAAIGDSFSKMRRIAASDDPEAYRLGIIKHVIRTLLTSLNEKIESECMETIVETVSQISEELSSVTI